MFKTIYSKYMGVMLGVIAGCFLLMTMVLLLVFRSYSQASRQEQIQNTTDSYAQIVNYSLSAIEPDSFSLSEQVREREIMFRNLMDITLRKVSSEEAYILSDAGEILLAFRAEDGETLYVQGETVEEGLLNALKTEETVTDVSLVRTDPERGQLAMATEQVIGPDGQVCGYIMTLGTASFFGRLTQYLGIEMMIVMVAILASMIIALFFVTRHVTESISKLEEASRALEKGDFSVRVPVRGKDEVAQLSAAFNKMAASLSAMEKANSFFVSNVSHEIRTPITVIGGYVENMRCGAIKPEEYDKYLSIIASEVNRLSRLVTRMLELARLEAGERHFVPADFDICEMGRQVLISFDQTIETKGLDIDFETEADPITVYGDPDSVYEVFYNICENAMKFSKEQGKIRIRIRTADEKDEEIHPGVFGQILVSVFNEGEGIAPEDRPHIFERFYKADKSRGLDKSGVGLGMHISKAIVTAQGGSIWVDSVPSVSCEFTFTLPISPDGFGSGPAVNQ